MRKGLLVFLFMYFVVALIAPLKAVYIWSILNSYLYIVVTKVLLSIVTAANIIRGWVL